MLNRKAEIIDCIEGIRYEYQKAVAAAPQLLDEASVRFFNLYNHVYKEVMDGELLVPVVGGFSAGKSTAINGVIGEEVLPVAVIAETAIPAELRYSDDEYILALNVNGDEEHHQISALSQLSANAANYEVVKIFLNRQVLKDIEPFVLVDMPGFDSTLDQHNRAILRYLIRGAFYLYLVNAKDGALQRQDIRRLDEILSMERGFSIFLTKKDLVTESELSKVKEFVDEQVLIGVGVEIHTGSIDMEDTSALLKELKETDPDYLFNSLFIGAVKDFYYTASADVNNAISAFKKNKSEGGQQIEELQRALASIIDERERNLSSIQSGSMMDAERRIISRLDNELNKSVEEFVSLAKAGNDALSRAVSDQVRRVLMNELQKTIGQISSDVVRGYTSSLNITVNTDLNLSEDWKQNLLMNLQTEVMNSLIGALDAKGSRTNGGDSGGVISTMSGLALVVPHPVVRVVLAVLPGIVDQLFRSASDSREKERYADAIRTQVIPSIIRQVSPEISSALLQISQSLVQAITEQYEVKIRQQKEIMEKAQFDFDEKLTDIENTLDILESVRKKINSIAEVNII